jgi:hypothetical protein
MVTGMPVTAAEFRRMRDQFCETCTLSNLHRSPFPTSASTSARPLQLLHVSLCGPYTTPTPLGSRYALVVLDDYSKFAFVRELKLKSDASPAIQHLVQECEARFHHGRFVVQSVRSDKGGEFEQGQLLSFQCAKGIRHETTVGYAPQPNGAAEHLLQTLNSITRALHHDALLPPEQWGQSMHHAAWIRSRLPAAGTGKKTPFELFMGAKPDLSNLHVYGAPSYALVQQPHISKMADRAEPGRYMGVDSAGILLLPRGAHKCVDPCHVRVVETEKPLAGILWQQHECDAAEPHVCPWAVLTHGSTGTSGLGKPRLALLPAAAQGSPAPEVPLQPATVQGLAQPEIAPQLVAVQGLAEPEIAPQLVAAQGLAEPAIAPQLVAVQGLAEPEITPQFVAAQGLAEPEFAPQPAAAPGLAKPAIAPQSAAVQGPPETGIALRPAAAPGLAEPDVVLGPAPASVCTRVCRACSCAAVSCSCTGR